MRRKLISKIGYRSKFCFILDKFMKHPLLILFTCVTCIGFLHLTIKNLYKTKQPQPINLPMVVVHFDLKGAPPNIKYLRSVLRSIKDLGANAILLEYEDMFPYEHEIKNLSTPFCYQKDDLVEFLQRATDVGLQVIPLIQTFGHLEYALKLEEFQHLREDPFYPDSLCPSKAGSIELIRHMITQVITLHKSVAPLKYIHIGGDEVYHINNCSDCTKRRLSDITLYIQHLKTVAKMIPDLKILIWDDMLRKTNINYNFQKELVQLDSEYQIQPVVWDYSTKVSGFSHKHIHLYQKAFKSMWVASAYKGADGSETVTPDLKIRLLNNLNWLRLIDKYKQLYNFNGIILTGWSRYTHFLPICDLLPASYRSLAINLLLIHGFKTNATKDDRIERYAIKDWDLASEKYFDDYLERIKDCTIDNISIQYRPECSLYTVETSKLYDVVVAYEDVIKKTREYFDSFDLKAKVVFGYMDNYALFEFLEKFQHLILVVKAREKLLKKYMRSFFDANVYTEYIAYKSYSTNEAQKTVRSMLHYVFNTSVFKNEVQMQVRIRSRKRIFIPEEED